MYGLMNRILGSICVLWFCGVLMKSGVVGFCIVWYCGGFGCVCIFSIFLF